MQPKTCIECKNRSARHWNSNFCEDCFREILKDTLIKELALSPASSHVEISSKH